MEGFRGGGVIAARFFRIAQILPGGGAFGVKLLRCLQHGNGFINAPGALQHDAKQIGQRKILGLSGLDWGHQIGRFGMAPSRRQGQGIGGANRRHRCAMGQRFGEGVSRFRMAPAASQQGGQLLPGCAIVGLFRQARAQAFFQPRLIGLG